MHDTTGLIRGAQGGDRALLEQLFAGHRGRLLAWISVAMPAALARRVPPEDLVQETLLEAARKLGGFEVREGASFYAWLVAIARHKLSEVQRAERADKRARGEPLDRDPTGVGTSPSQAAQRADRALLLGKALAELPPAQAQALRLRYLEGHSTSQVALEMGRTELAVKSLVTRAFAELARRIPASLADSAPPARVPPPFPGLEDSP